jgi:hypothetical protein
MSSRRLLVLLKYPREQDWLYKDAILNGRRSHLQRAVEEVRNELLRLRSQHALVASQGQVRWDPEEFVWRDPIDERERAEKLEAEAEEAQDATEEFFTELGFT